MMYSQKVKNLSPSNWNLKKIFARYPCCYFVFYENVADLHLIWEWCPQPRGQVWKHVRYFYFSPLLLAVQLTTCMFMTCISPCYMSNTTNFPHWTLQHTYQVHGIRTEFSIPYPPQSAYIWLLHRIRTQGRPECNLTTVNTAPSSNNFSRATDSPVWAVQRFAGSPEMIALCNQTQIFKWTLSQRVQEQLFPELH
jgi:hypothetical protein